MPFNKLSQWLDIEKERDIAEPNCAVLSTCDHFGTPHSRVVAIREIATDSLLFFTQLKTRKVTELLNNPKACLNFLLSAQNRQVILEGEASPITHEENLSYWSTLARKRQLRFTAYAPTSGQIIKNLEQLENKKQELIEQFADKPIPMSEHYFGFRFIPTTWIFYTVSSISFSQVIRYTKQKDAWETGLLSP